MTNEEKALLLMLEKMGDNDKQKVFEYAENLLEKQYGLEVKLIDNKPKIIEIENKQNEFNMVKTSLQIRKERNDKIVTLWHEVTNNKDYANESKSARVSVVTSMLNETNEYKPLTEMAVKKVLATYGVDEFSNYKSQLKKSSYGK